MMVRQQAIGRFLAAVCLVAFGFLPVCAAEESEFRSIFDGKSLAGWDGNPKFWSVEDGAITGQTTAANPAKGNTFLIWRGGRPADFELKCEFRMPNRGFANSGVQFRSWEEPKKWGRWVVGGYQADMDDTGRYVGDLYCERDRGQVGAARPEGHHRRRPPGKSRRIGRRPG